MVLRWLIDASCFAKWLADSFGKTAPRAEGEETTAMEKQACSIRGQGQLQRVELAAPFGLIIGSSRLH